METIPIYWKPFLVVEAIRFSGSHSFLWKLLPLVEDIAFSGMEDIPFSGNHSFLVESVPCS